jgi:putative spermidine/putrescine transport system substrate-binding protein
LYAGEREMFAAALVEGTCVSFNTAPDWANWSALFRAFKDRYPKVELSYNELGSMATVTAMKRARRRPQADTAYCFAASGVNAAQRNLVEPFKPLNFDRIPPVFRDPEGRWFAVHSLTIAFLVNRKLVKNVPHSRADLLRPEYKNCVAYMDPRATGIGQVLTIAAAFGNGGGMDRIGAGTDYLGRLHAVGNIRGISGVTQYAKFLAGQIPIRIGYEGDGLRAKYIEKNGWR